MDQRPTNIPGVCDNPAAAAKRLIDESFKSSLSLDEIAADVQLNSRTLRNVFRKQFGVSPSQYRLSLRIAHVKRLLVQGKPIKQVATESGFFDQPHLTRHFKRITGKTPSQFLAAQNTAIGN